jgi:hypothetical protein
MALCCLLPVSGCLCICCFTSGLPRRHCFETLHCLQTYGMPAVRLAVCDAMIAAGISWAD